LITPEPPAAVNAIGVPSGLVNVVLVITTGAWGIPTTVTADF